MCVYVLCVSVLVCCCVCMCVCVYASSYAGDHVCVYASSYACVYVRAHMRETEERNGLRRVRFGGAMYGRAGRGRGARHTLPQRIVSLNPVVDSGGCYVLCVCAMCYVLCAMCYVLCVCVCVYVVCCVRMSVVGCACVCRCCV